MTTTEEVIQRERQFLLQTYNRYPLVIERGKGVFLFDLDGKKYLDFVAGLGGTFNGSAVIIPAGKLLDYRSAASS